MNKIIRTLLLLLVLMTAPAIAMAQDSDAAYQKGVSMMNSANYTGAVAQFNASKRINKSESNVKRCNAMIAQCQKLMKQKKSSDNTKDRRRSKTDNSRFYGSYLEIFPQDMVFGNSSSEVKEISVNTDKDDWTCSVNRKEGESEWCVAEKVSNGQMKITCSPSDKTTARSTSVIVKSGSVKDSVIVRQPAGARAELYIEKYQADSKDVYLPRGEDKNPVIVASKKNGLEQVVVKLICKSDTIYNDGYNNNWTVTSMPKWCNRSVTKRKLAKGFKKLKNKITGNTTKEAGEPVEEDEFVFEIPAITDSKLLKTGRIDKIVLRSQDQQCVISISQTDK